jgi:hypothetical protein
LHGDEPGDQAGDECDTRADSNRPAMRAFRTGHARGDGRENENAFESLAKNQNADVEECDSRARVGLRRIGRAVRSESLPDNHRHDNDRRH